MALLMCVCVCVCVQIEFLDVSEAVLLCSIAMNLIH